MLMIGRLFLWTFLNRGKEGGKMNTKEAKIQMRQLRKQIKAKKVENDLLLLKLFVLLIFLSVIAAVYFGKIPLPELPDLF